MLLLVPLLCFYGCNEVTKECDYKKCQINRLVFGLLGKYKPMYLAVDDYLVRITHSGICGLDEHFEEQDIVLGHEGVGFVEAVGSAAKSLKRFSGIP